MDLKLQLYELTPAGDYLRFVLHGMRSYAKDRTHRELLIPDGASNLN